ncbi:hypothetical protein HN371_02280 [Candidatus Poribacteria bacterium]|jgi:hypothetical protein|nr:hypothetical protein [Candidatus Poribacteria bacterium]MBT5536991.1 hypothetical protein [Candidatus Poribacteria bacterium]MBT5710981.1 hypothetical protein [Candidatus Poribacteria bacterium]MBT7096074.1 hypothetical protein [Candidatus Poribacteria bacterium]MBT7804975.1 hypothetical protein [Candidatus Poribacteria bacterium]
MTPNPPTRQGRFPLHGIVGLCLLIGTLACSIYDHYNPGASSIAHRVSNVTTALCWWGYLLFVDAWIARLKGGSLLTTRRSEFWVQVPLSIIVWIVFEIYNFHMRNWHYEGISVHRAARMFGAMAAFATVLPGVLSTAEWLEAVGFCRRLRAPVIQASSKAAYTCVFLGIFCLTFPLMMPREIAKYLFALVWMGFVFLLDPLNHASGAPSLFGDLAKGQLQRSACLFAAGMLCGFWWESWNYLAATKWVYDAPFTPGISIFEMPLAGFIGFGPFAWELFAMYHFARVVLGIEEGGDEPSAGEA